MFNFTLQKCQEFVQTGISDNPALWWLSKGVLHTKTAQTKLAKKSVVQLPLPFLSFPLKERTLESRVWSLKCQETWRNWTEQLTKSNGQRNQSHSLPRQAGTSGDLRSWWAFWSYFCSVRRNRQSRAALPDDTSTRMSLQSPASKTQDTHANCKNTQHHHYQQTTKNLLIIMNVNYELWST